MRGITNLGFPEALRWRGDWLWFSDMFTGKVMRVNLDESMDTVIDVNEGGPVMPGGLGWLPSGELIVVDCLERKLLKLTKELNLILYADLSELTTYPLNDMYIDPYGNVWVGGYGFDPEIDLPRPSPLFRVFDNGRVSLSVDKFIFPNGCEGFGDQLALAETFADRVSFLNDQGKILEQFHLPSGYGPDGISHDKHGNLYIASAFLGTLDCLSNDGKFYNVIQIPRLDDNLNSGGPLGVFDCAAHPSLPVLAYASASANENYARLNKTGEIHFINI